MLFVLSLIACLILIITGWIARGLWDSEPETCLDCQHCRMDSDFKARCSLKGHEVGEEDIPCEDFIMEEMKGGEK